MSQSAVQRLCLLLRLLPHSPGHVGMTVSTLHRGLRGKGFDVCRRTVQRDLEFLARAFPVARTEGDDSGDLWKLSRKVGMEMFLRPIAEPELPLDLPDEPSKRVVREDRIEEIPEWDSDIVLHDLEGLKW